MGRDYYALDMLPLAYEREIKDLVFSYKAVYSYIDIDVSDYATFNNLSTYTPWSVYWLLSYFSGL